MDTQIIESLIDIMLWVLVGYVIFWIPCFIAGAFYYKVIQVEALEKKITPEQVTDRKAWALGLMVLPVFTILHFMWQVAQRVTKL